MPLRADPRCSCAAGGDVRAPRFARSRAGYRSAQYLVFTPSFSQAPGSLGADGGTVGGSAGIVQLAGLFQQQVVDSLGSPQGFLSGHDFSLVWEQNMDIPVPHGHGGRAGRGGLQGARPGQNSAAFVEQNTLKFQFLEVVVEEEVFSFYAKIRIQLLHPRTRLVLRMRFLKEFFALFSGRKRCDTTSAFGVGTASALEPMDAGGSWRAHGARASAGGGVRGGVP